MSSNKKSSSFKKTEDVLNSYPALKKISVESKNNHVKTKDIVSKIENGLKEIVNDPYYEVISMYYFDGNTIEEIAYKFNVSSPSIIYAKKRLVNKLKVFIFTENVIEELCN